MTAFLGNILGSLLRFVYEVISSIGTEPAKFSFYAMSIIVTTIIFRLVLLPISLHQMKSTRKMSEIQPKIKKLQDKYKDDPQTLNVKTMELYKENKYNPASGCIVLLLQFPIIIAFFSVFREPQLYAFKDPVFYESMNKSFLWISNLENVDPYLWGLPLLAAVTTYFQSITMQQPSLDPQAKSTQKMMSYFLPVMILITSKGFPAGLGLYWVVGNIFQIIQQVLLNRSFGKLEGDK